MALPKGAGTPVWETGDELVLPVLEADLEADVCVVGLGGSGLACVQALLELGVRVVGLDAGTVAGGAAGRNGGFLLAGTAAFYHDAVKVLGRERAKAIYMLTLEALDRMTAETPEAIRRVGSLRIALDDEELEDCQSQLAAMRQDGLPVENYDGPEGCGLLFPEDGVFNPLHRCRTLARRVSDAGAQLFGHSPVTSLSGTEVRTPRGTVRCKSVVVAVDGGLEHLLPELSGRVRSARLQMLATAPTDELTFPRPVYSRYGYEYWQQLPDRSIALGGFRDEGGESEWTSNTTPEGSVQESLTAFLRNTLGVSAPVTHRWAASVGYTESILPIFEEVRKNLWAIGGYNGTGNVIGAICGRAAAQLAAGRDSSVAELFRCT